MRISVDNGETWQEISNVRIQYAVDTFDYFTDCIVQFNHTEEGIITDVIDPKGQVVVTDLQTADEILDRLVGAE